MDVVRAVVQDFEIEEVIIAEETKKISPEIAKQLVDLCATKKNKGNDLRITYIPHAQFKDRVLHGAERGEPVACFVKTGEFTPYANVMLVSSVPF